MATLRDIILYLCQHYPYENELSRARITKLVYLADWKHAIDHGNQMSGINWYFDNYGPFVWDVWRTAESTPDSFNIEHTHNMYGARKHIVRAVDDADQAKLSTREIATLDHVIRSTMDLNWDQFIKLVYSTYPVMSSERYSPLNLTEKAGEYLQQLP